MHCIREYCFGKMCILDKTASQAFFFLLEDFHTKILMNFHADFKQQFCFVNWKCEELNLRLAKW